MLTEEDVMRHVEEQECLRRQTDQSFVFKCFVWMGLILFVLFVFYVYKNHIKTNKYVRAHELNRSVSNAKQMYLVLLDFESDYGYFPDDNSAARDKALSGFTGSYSNDYLGQLIEGGYTKSEEIFYAMDKRYSRRIPDDVISPFSQILEKNECGFSYVMVEEKGKHRGLSTKDNGSIPILVTPLVNEWGSCEMTSYDKRAVYLRVDGSARSERLRPSDQKILIGGGMTLFDKGASTVWGSLNPVVLLPER